MYGWKTIRFDLIFFETNPHAFSRLLACPKPWNSTGKKSRQGFRSFQAGRGKWFPSSSRGHSMTTDSFVVAKEADLKLLKLKGRELFLNTYGRV
jgi:hypothetical protein